MLPLGVTVANIGVGYIINSINLCIDFIDRHDLKKEVKESCCRLYRELSSCQENANNLNEYISKHRIKEIWQPTVEGINDCLKSIESRLVMLLTDHKLGNNFITKSRRKFRHPQDMEKKLNALITEVRHIDDKIFNFQLINNAHAEAKVTATNHPQPDDRGISELRTSSVGSISGNELRLATCVTQTPLEALMLDACSTKRASSTETTAAFSLVSDLARGFKDLIVWANRALIAAGDEALIRVQEELVARAIADCSQNLGLLGNKKWYFFGGDVLPEFVLKMAMTTQPDASRRKIVDKLMSLSSFGSPQINLDVHSKEKWDAATIMDVSFVNALIFKHYYNGSDGPRARGKAGIANEINSELNISASNMLLVLQALRWQRLIGQGLVIVSNGEQGLGWYRVLFLDVDRLGQENEISAFRLEYVCGLENSESGSYVPADAKDIMILNFLHVIEISPRARQLTENGRSYSYMQTGLKCEMNMFEGDQAMFDAIKMEGYDYTELLEIACLYTLRAGFHARCQSFVDTLVDRVDQRQLLVWTGGSRRHLHLRKGREVSFKRLEADFYKGVSEDAQERNILASCDDLYEYGRFCAQDEVMQSWYDLLVPAVVRSVDVNFAQAALTGRGSYTKFVANNKSVLLKDSVLLCDQASDSVAVAFDGVSEMSSSLKLQISDLVDTTESQRLRAAFFICRGAVRARRDSSTSMLDVVRSRFMGLQGIENISVQDIVEDLDEGERRNPAVVVECMESLAMQGGYKEDPNEESLFAALCSYHQCEKKMLVSGDWPPLLDEFIIFRSGLDDWVKLELSSKLVIFASKQGNIYRAQKIGLPPNETPGILSTESVSRSYEFIGVC